MEQTPAEPKTEAEAQDEQGQAQEHLAQILARMGYDDVEVSVEQEDDRLSLNITGGDEAALIGSKGQTLDALQFIVSRIMNNREGYKRPLVVDCGGYRARRTEALTELAGKLKDEALRSGSTVAINPMSAHDRRVIHMVLKEEPGVTTHSEGDGIYRRVLVVPQ